MQKKHSFSPNHKVVTASKHNFSSHGEPSTASMSQPPQSIGGGGEQPGGDSDGASMGGMNFCNGGQKYSDGGDVDEPFHAIRDVGRQLMNGSSTTTVHSKDDSTPTASNPAALSDVVPGGSTVAGRKAQIDNAVEDASK